MNQPKLTLGSLFDGIGGFCLAGQMAGIQPVWASEIEPFPIRVTEKRFPDVRQLGDIHALHGEDVPPVDIITFGSPCQNLSMSYEIHNAVNAPAWTANSPRCFLRLSESSKK